jgi:hypothetical protein
MKKNQEKKWRDRTSTRYSFIDIAIKNWNKNVSLKSLELKKLSMIN